ncbi:MAG: hypothetical protein EXS29_07980 [Pedosphaera sp.]|nr:hypothetical protein [Pedosphaera sp.]
MKQPTHWINGGVIFAMALLIAGPALAQIKEEPIDWNRAGELHRRSQRGEKLTAAEQAYYDRARKQREAGQQRQPAAANPNAPLTNAFKATPLTELGGEKYKGEDGGLYGGGRNEPPAAHLAAARKESAHIRPLDAQGKPSADGKIALVSIGMSNTTQEFSEFVRLGNADATKSPRVVLIDGAQGAMEALAWATLPRPWDTLMSRLQTADVSTQQVQVAWVKLARAGPARLGEFPKHAEEMKAHEVKILQMLRQRFPNLRVAYLSNRIYAGYATSQLNPEPYAYESAFTVRWLIQDQIAGKAELSFGSSKDGAKSPLLLWGPYLWANGAKPNKDGLVWLPEDFTGDYTHPGNSGRRKVAEQLLKFFKTDSVAKAWFLKTGGAAGSSQ